MKAGGEGRGVICSPMFALICALALISGNAGALLMHLGALFLHECAHCLMAGLLGCRAAAIWLLPYGCRMDILGMDSPWDEFMIALSGPVFSLLCFMGSRMIPKAADFSEANMYIAIINLLPVYPLDGGRVLNGLLEMAGIAPGRVFRIVSALTLSAVTGICGFFSKNIMLTVFSLFLLSEGIAAIRERGGAVLSHMRNMRCAASGRGVAVRHIALSEDVTVHAALSYTGSGYTVFCILDDSLEEKARVDGVSLARLGAVYGSHKSLGDIIPYIDRSK